MSYISPRTKLLHHPDRLAVLAAGRVPVPVNIEIDLSNRCSLGCQWCHFAATHTRGPLAGKVEQPEGKIPGGDLMDVLMIHRALREFKEAGVKSVTWTGGGEPTLHPKFDGIVRYASAVGIDQGLYTHGGHINDDRAALLKENLSWVYVSLDAADAADYARDKNVPSLRFERALEGIRSLVAADGDATIGIGFLLTRQNHERYHEMYQLAQDLGVDYCQFRPTILFSHSDPSKRGEDATWVRRLLHTMHEQGVHTWPRCEIDYGRFQRYVDWKGSPGYQTCYWSTLQSVVTPNGKMWTCVNKREYAGEEIGDLSAESFKDICDRRTKAPAVNDRCRLLCRGDVANQQLDDLMAPISHANFP